MLVFCPMCGNMLYIAPVEERECTTEDKAAGIVGKNAFQCRTCPYRRVLDRRYYERTYMKTKEVDDILGGKDSWKNVDKTEVSCPTESCDSREAYFRQVQIRSADEPMTSFYRCTKCSRDWMEK